MVQMVHVQTIGHDFPAKFVALLNQGWIANRHGGIDGHRRGNAMTLQGLHDSVNTDSVAIVTQCVMPKIWIRRLHGARRFERHTGHVQGEPL